MFGTIRLLATFVLAMAEVERRVRIEPCDHCAGEFGRRDLAVDRGALAIAAHELVVDRGCGERLATRWVYSQHGVGYAMCDGCNLG